MVTICTALAYVIQDAQSSQDTFAVEFWRTAYIVPISWRCVAKTRIVNRIFVTMVTVHAVVVRLPAVSVLMKIYVVQNTGTVVLAMLTAERNVATCVLLAAMKRLHLKENDFSRLAIISNSSIVKNVQTAPLALRCFLMGLILTTRLTCFPNT